MIELGENLFQMAALGFGFGVSAYHYARGSSRRWLLLSLYYATTFLGDLYWVLLLTLLHRSPKFDYVSDCSWFAGYLFLFLLTRYLLPEEPKRSRNILIWIGPVFTACMAIYYMQWGKVMSNIADAAAMGLIFMNAAHGLLMLRGKAGRKHPLKRYFLTVTILCLLEYLLWTVSCFWEGDTWSNPYYWIDIFVSFGDLLLLLAVKEVDEK